MGKKLLLSSTIDQEITTEKQYLWNRVLLKIGEKAQIKPGWYPTCANGYNFSLEDLEK